MAENKNKGQQYKEIEQYVNNACAAFIEPHGELVSISCRHTGSEGEGYIKVVDASDTANYYSVTDLTAEEICKLVATLVNGDYTRRKIEDYEQRKTIAQLFR